MQRDLLQRFARFLTSDTAACASLFAPDAVYRARFGEVEIELCGRDEIRRFLEHVPRQIVFGVGATEQDGREWKGELLVRASDLQTRTQPVRFSVRDGRFQRFEQVR